MLEEEPKAPSLSPRQRDAIALLDAWIREDENISQEQRAQNDADFEAFKANLNRSRAEEGRAPSFL